MNTLVRNPGLPPLENSRVLRLLTVALFYFAQGVPVGLFFTAIPAWMAANGISTEGIAAVVSASVLPWTLKLANGFIMDRYTYLAMGRRRIWIIGAQFLMVFGFLLAAALSPEASDVWLLSALGFTVHFAAAFQDVGIDSLAVDIMEEDERGKAAGVMFGMQTLGYSSTAALGGVLLENYGFSTAMLTTATVPLLVFLFGVSIRERTGEKRLPWSPGAAHPRNTSIQAEAWWPLLRNSFRALFAPLSMVMLVILFTRSFPIGAGETFHPVMTTQQQGWDISEYTSLIASAQFAGGMIALLIGGWAIDRLGAQRSAIAISAVTGGLMLVMAFGQDRWGNPGFLPAVFTSLEILYVLASASIIPIAMRLCTPAVAATQFTIYMATANFGRPLGAWLSTQTAGAGDPQMMYLILAGITLLGAVLLVVIRFPSGREEPEAVAEELPQAGAIAPQTD